MRPTPYIVTLAVSGLASAVLVGGTFVWQAAADVNTAAGPATTTTTTTMTTTTTVEPEIVMIPGPRGPRGFPGLNGADGDDSTVPGPAGRNGQDGNDSTVPGPAGADSTVPGPAGADGESIVGPAGPPGADSTVPGPPGPQGIQGIPGPAPEMVSGNVNPDGTVFSGIGFTSVQLGTGRYQITFAAPFTTPPAMVATKVYGSVTVDAGVTVGFGEITVDQITATTAIIATSSSAGFLVDSAFGFLAMGSVLVPSP